MPTGLVVMHVTNHRILHVYMYMYFIIKIQFNFQVLSSPVEV